MKSIITHLVLALSALPLGAEPPQEGDYNENILIFTGEVRNFIELSEQMREVSSASASPTKDQELQALLLELQTTASRVAEVYFSEASDESRDQFTSFLSATLVKHQDIKNYFVFIGNAFASEAQMILDRRSDRMKKIFVWSSIGGVVLGLAGGAMVLKFQGATKNYVTAGIVAVGIAAVASGGGFAARYFLPVSQEIVNAKDFLERFPHGEDFTKELESTSMDLAMGMDEVMGDSQ